MGDKIIHCEWKSAQPDFYKEVECDGVVIGTIHALTKDDYSELSKFTKYEFADKSTFVIIERVKLEIKRMLLSLTGQKKSGWNLDKEITEEVIANELPDKYFNAFNTAIIELENQSAVTEGIAKN